MVSYKTYIKMNRIIIVEIVREEVKKKRKGYEYKRERKYVRKKEEKK